MPCHCDPISADLRFVLACLFVAASVKGFSYQFNTIGDYFFYSVRDPTNKRGIIHVGERARETSRWRINYASLRLF